MGLCHSWNDINSIRRLILVHGLRNPVSPDYQQRRDLAELCSSTPRINRQETLNMPNGVKTFKQKFEDLQING